MHPSVRSLLIVAGLMALFLVANRTAYKGYFDPDDLDNIGWTGGSSIDGYLGGLISPKLYTHNFRPLGHLYYRQMTRLAGLNYDVWLAALHGLHLVAIALVWLLLRRLRFALWPAAAGALFFACHMGAFEAYWKPMYVFDVLCAIFCLLCLLCWMRGSWLLSLAAMWLAYKSKEFAVMLPVVLAWYEWQLGERRWKRLIPFFAVSLLFGGQALLATQQGATDYRMQFHLAALAVTIPFYAAKLGLAPFAGLLLLAVPLAARDRRATWGVVMLVALLAPMLFLPERLFGAYLYAPLMGGAVAMAGLASRGRRALMAVGAFYLLWIPLNFVALRRARADYLGGAMEMESYVARLQELRASAPDTRVFLYDGMPERMREWGVVGALRAIFAYPVEVVSMEQANGAELFGDRPMVLLAWDPMKHRLRVVPRGKDLSYVDIESAGPVWQLTSGWFPRENAYRWTRPRASAVLARPGAARLFAVKVNIPDQQIALLGRVRLRVKLDGAALEEREITAAGWQEVQWTVPGEERPTVQVELETTPVYRPPGDSRELGVPVGAFGFRTTPGTPR